MSRENVEVVLEAVEAFNRRDVDAFVAFADPEVEWEDAIFWTETERTYRGRVELREWFRRVLDPWESIHLEVDEISERRCGAALVAALGGALFRSAKASQRTYAAR